MSFVNAVEKKVNKTAYTENGALSYQSSLDDVLDFFSKSGALRNKHEEYLDHFIKAFRRDKTLANKALFYSRDIRGGQGERENFKRVLKWLATRHAEEFKPNLKLIPFFGRWDDLYAFVGTPLQDAAFQVMKDQFDEDVKLLDEGKSAEQAGSFRPKPVSLLGKWLKSENTSSKESKQLGRLTRKFFALNSKAYRQKLSELRKRIDIVERFMTSGNWSEINYEYVPSKAMKNYIKAFKKHDEVRYNEYIRSVQKGTAKINASTLYPYEIVREFISDYSVQEPDNSTELDELWKHLPNYFDSEAKNVMCVVDVSGSMCDGHDPRIKPIHVAISLGLYMAERNHGPFKDCFLTFSTSPQLVKVRGNTLYEKIKFMIKANWTGSTNIMNAFKLILDVAVENQLKQEDIPEKLFIISDMQFDEATDQNDKTTFEAIDEMFSRNGYKRPELVFWNVNAKSDSPVTKDEVGAYLVSGMSPTILKNALNVKETTALELMLDVLNGDRYKEIV